MEEIAQQTIDREKKNGYTEQQIRESWKSSTSMYEFQQKLKKFAISTTQQGASKTTSNTKQIKIIRQSYGYDNDDYYEEAINESIKSSAHNPYNIFRQDKLPCGLLNIGTTCYFNCLIQNYFFNYDFVNIILKWKPPENITIFENQIQSSIELVAELQSLIIKMVGSDESYIDPSTVLYKIANMAGINIMQQHDVAEFNDIFLTKIQEGLYPELSKYENSSKQRQQFIENSKLHQTFFGKFNSSIVVDGVIESSQQVTFNLIPINIAAGNLEEGFESYMNSEIDNFRSGNNQIKTRIAIVEPPQVLQFHIQRVSFRKDLAKTYKDNKEFQFDKEIDIGKYIKRKQSPDKKLQEIQLQLSQVTEQIKKFSQYDGNINIIQNLKTTLKYLQNSKNGTNEPMFIVRQPSEESMQQLTLHIEELEQRYISLLEQKEKLQLQLTSYQGNNDQSTKYFLQSIIMHQGFSEAGHYYSYIYDFQTNKWFHINDINVAEESEQIVLNTAYGSDYRTKGSAYLLVYVNKESVLREQNSKIPIRSFRLSQTKEYLSDAYGYLLQDYQKKQLEINNREFYASINDYGDKIPYGTVVDQYCSYYDTVMAKYNKLEKNRHDKQLLVNPPMISHITLYLQDVSYYKKMDTLKWLLIDYTLRELNPTKQGVFTKFSINQNVQNRIGREITSRFYYQPDDVKTIKFVPLQVCQFQRIKDEYLSNLKISFYFVKLIEKYLENNYRVTLQLLQYLLKQLQYLKYQQCEKFEDLISHYYILLQLGILCNIFNKASQDDVQVIQLIVSMILQNKVELLEFPNWVDSVALLILVISEKHPMESQIAQQKDRLIRHRVDNESLSLLNALPANFGQECNEIIKTYNLDKLFGQNEDYIFGALINNLEKLYEQEKPKKLLQTIQGSTSKLNRLELLQIIQ